MLFIKIIHILSDDDIYGSAKSFLELLSNEVLSDGIEPYVITPVHNRIIDYCKKNNIKCNVVQYEQFQIPKHNSMFIFIVKYIYHGMMYIIKNKIALKKLEKIVLNESIELVHSNSSVIDIGAQLSQICHIPHVWHIREYGKEDFNLFSLYPFFIKRMNKKTNSFICISEAMKNSWISKGLDKNKINVICHGVDANQFADCFVKEHQSIKAVMCGSFTESKGQDILVKAIGLLSPSEQNKIHVDLYGKQEGEYYSKVVDLVKELKLNDVISFMGYTNCINEVLQSYNIGIMCSKAEAMGRVTIEYMMAGLCPIVSNAGANIEIIKNNSCGFLFDVKKPQELATILSNIIGDSSLLVNYAYRSKDIARKYYDSNINTKLIINLFKNYDKK